MEADDHPVRPRPPSTSLPSLAAGPAHPSRGGHHAAGSWGALQLGQLLDDLLNDARDPPTDETRKDQTAAPAPAPAPAPATDGAAPTPAAVVSASALPQQAGAGAMKVKILKCDNCKVAYEICLPGAGGGSGGSSSEGTTAAALPPTATPAGATPAEEGGGGGGVEPG